MSDPEEITVVFPPEALRQLWQAGIASGPGRLKSIDAIKTEARRRAANAAKPEQ